MIIFLAIAKVLGRLVLWFGIPMAVMGISFVVNKYVAEDGVAWLVVAFYWAVTIILSVALFLMVHRIFGRRKGILLFNIGAVALSSIWSHAQLYASKGITCMSCETTTTVHDPITALYYSIVTWTTLGYGDYVPVKELMMVAASQALMGLITMGLLVGVGVSVVSNRCDAIISDKPSRAKGT